MKTALVILALVAATIGPVIYDATGPITCRVGYATSFDGLYLLKQRTCSGRLFGGDPKTIARKPLFTEF